LLLLFLLKKNQKKKKKIAAQTLDVMALNIAPEQMIPVAISNIQNYLKSENPNYRRASMIALAVIFEFMIFLFFLKFAPSHTFFFSFKGCY